MSHKSKEEDGIVMPINEVLNGIAWDHEDFSGQAEKSASLGTGRKTSLYMIVAGDEQTPCRWNGRQLAVEWIDDKGVPLFSHDQALELIEQTYEFFSSIGRTAKPILRAVPVFQPQAY